VSGQFAESSARTLEDLLAREAIADVVKRLARGTDRLDEELIASCYHPGATDDHGFFRGSGTEFARWVVETMPRFEATMHFVGSPYVRHAGDLAYVDTYCVAHHIASSKKEAPMKDMVMGLRYVDRFERRDGEWRIAARVCVYDWTYTVPYDPVRSFEYEPGTVFGARNRTDFTYQRPPPSAGATRCGRQRS
jgi:hypothetical protein